MNPDVENTTRRGKEPHAIPNMVMRYVVRHLEYIQVVPAPEGLKVKYLDLNKRGACDLNKGMRAKSPPNNGCENGRARTDSRF